MSDRVETRVAKSDNRDPGDASTYKIRNGWSRPVWPQASDDLPYNAHLKQCIYLVTNPFDVMLSMLHHYVLEGVEHVEGQKGMERFYRWFFDRAHKNHLETTPDNLGGWNNHVCSWLKHNTEFPTYVIRYEDLCADTVSVSSTLNEELKLGFSRAEEGPARKEPSIY